LAAAVLFALVIPVNVCLGDECGSRALWEQDSAAGFNLLQVASSATSREYQWPLRVGILTVGVLSVILTYVIAAPRREERR
jgi:hypothetical protein